MRDKRRRGTHVFGADGLDDGVWRGTEELGDDAELVDIWIDRRGIVESAQRAPLPSSSLLLTSFSTSSNRSILSTSPLPCRPSSSTFSSPSAFKSSQQKQKGQLTVLPREQRLPDQHLRQNTSNTPDIDRMVVLLPREHDLGRSVVSSGDVASHL
jgi:hypothetical protein